MSVVKDEEEGCSSVCLNVQTGSLKASLCSSLWKSSTEVCFCVCADVTAEDSVTLREQNAEKKTMILSTR